MSGSLIRKLRKSKNWSQEHLAAVADVSVRTIRRAEKGESIGYETLFALAEMLDVDVEVLTTDSNTTSETSNEAGIDGYRTRLLRRLRSMSPLIPLKIGDKDATELLRTNLEEHRCVHVWGVSGAGKSHLARHLVQNLTASGTLCVVGQARYFEGNFNTWIDQAVAPYSTKSFERLVEAADSETPILLLADGLNECGSRHLDELGAQLQGTLLRFAAVRVLTTSQTDDNSIANRSLGIGLPSQDEKEAMLRGLGLEELPSDETLEILRTPFDCAVAASVWSTGGTEASKYALVDSFVRKKLAEYAPEWGHRVLREIASSLTEDIRTSCPLSTLARACERATSKVDQPLANLLRSSLVEVRGPSCAFRHDQLMDYFAAEQLLLAQPSTDKLADVLQQPRYRLFAPFIVEAQEDPQRAAELFRTSVKARSCLTDAALGRHGTVAKQAADEVLSSAAARAITAMDDGALRWEVTEREQNYEVKHVTSNTFEEWVPESLAALGRLMPSDSVFATSQRVLEKVDETLEKAAARVADVHNLTKRGALFMLFGTLATSQHGAYGWLSGANRVFYRHEGPREFSRITDALDFVPRLGPVQLLFLLKAAMRVNWQGEDKEAVALKNALISNWESIFVHAWTLGCYHLRLEALSLLRLLGVGDKKIGREIVAILENLQTNSPGLNSMIVETLGALGGITEPMYDLESLRNHVARLLKSPHDEPSQQRANGYYNMQFEPIRAVEEPHSEVIHELTGSSRTRFFAMAALGELRNPGFIGPALLRDLLDAELGAHDELAKAALREWAMPPTDFRIFPNIRAEGFAIACTGLGRLGVGQPPIASPVDLEQKAWHEFGNLYLSLGACETDLHETMTTWRSLKQLGLSTLLPLHYLLRVGRPDGKPPPSLRKHFPAQLGELFEMLATFLPLSKDSSDEHSRQGFSKTELILRGLGEFAGKEADSTLRQHVDDPVLGAVAIEALQEHQKRHSSAR